MRYLSRSLSSNWAHSTITSALNTRVRSHLVQVVSNACLCDGAHIALFRLEHIWVVGRQDSGSSADYWAKRVVHLLGRGLVNSRLEGGALCGGGGGGRDGWVLAQVVVVIGGCTYDGALSVV